MNMAEIRGMLTATERPRPCVTNAPSLLGRTAVVVTSVQNSSGMEVPIRDEILRGFFHRENRILLIKSQIFALDTILSSPYNIKKVLKNRIFQVYGKIP